MLPWAIRRRSASGDMSTSSTWSAARTTASGTVSRCGTPVIFSTTSLSDSRCWMLTVEMTSMPASSSSSTSCQRFSLRRAGHVGVRQLVHQRDLRPAGEHRVEVHLLEGGAAVAQPGPRDHLQAVDQCGGVRAAVGLDEADHHVGAALGTPVPLAQHGVGLADACGAAQIDPEVSRVRTAHRLPASACLSDTSLPRRPRPEVTAGARFLRTRGFIPGAGTSDRGRC